MDESKYTVDKAKSYQRKKQILSLVNLVLTPLLLLLVAWTPLSKWFYDHSGFADNRYLLLAVYFFIFSVFMLLVDFPLTFYSGYTLEHQYGLSNHTVAGWFVDLIKRVVLSFLLSLALIEMLYALIWKFPEQWWLFAWGALIFVQYFMGKVFPVFIVPMFYKYSQVEKEDVRKRIIDLASRYGLPLENVYSLNLSRTTKKANAAFMGIGKTKRVVLSDTLLENFSTDEIETVVAHELGHFKHRDIWRGLAFGVVAYFINFWLLYRVMGPVSGYFGYSGVEDIAALPVLFLVFTAFNMVLMPVKSGFSRMMERAADRFALKAFPKKEIFISCMDKLAKVNLADPEPHPVYEWFFYDHPAIAKRIQMARETRI